MLRLYTKLQRHITGFICIEQYYMIGMTMDPASINSFNSYHLKECLYNVLVSDEDPEV